ncbi:MAG: Lrp/AsnC family transcriptional regulator [Thermoplasmata archaeon]|nr:Lrp/AsnC family transcriptional regulator [Candidatus Sysuiplasma acidicola]MBX8646650.1 Lrp/AsnC family transcriptional regulator [Candidatus Sysuiplasma acidicola]
MKAEEDVVNSEHDVLIDGTDRRLLNEIQWEFPLVRRPYLALGRKLGLSEEVLMQRIEHLREIGVIRQINAIYDTRRLGYSSTLVSFSVEEDRIDDVAEKINGHPGVSHNYRREGEFNLWFTLATPPGTDVGSEAARLAAENGVVRWHLLPALKLYKIGVRLNMTGEHVEVPKEKRKWDTPFTVTEEDRKFIRATQKDLSISAEPFESMAAEAGMSVEEMFDRFRSYHDLGVMRRFAAILRHQKAGFVANGMVCWKADETVSQKVAEAAVEYSEVSHCYMRPTYGDWPYSTYTMIHGREKKECERIAAEISAKTGITDYVVLYSTREYKKKRVEYFV